MALNFGSATPSAYYLGSNVVSEVYFGDTKVWPIGVTGEVISIDFNELTSYYSGSKWANNIADNRLYTASNVISMSLTITGSPLIVNLSDPSGSGIMLKFSASAEYGLNYQMLSSSGSTGFWPATSNAFSIETWIRPYPKVSGSTNQFLKGPNSNPIFGMYPNWWWGISNLGTNNGAMLVYQNAPTQSWPVASSSVGTVDFGNWNHLVMTANRTAANAVTFTMYKNGVSQTINTTQFTGWGLSNATTAGNGNIGRGATSGSVGNNLAGGFYDMSTFNMYNKVLSSTDVQTLYDTTKARYGV